jgi:hypothetical protein
MQGTTTITALRFLRSWGRGGSERKLALPKGGASDQGIRIRPSARCPDRGPFVSIESGLAESSTTPLSCSGGTQTWCPNA